jgi:hypothetical protein
MVVDWQIHAGRSQDAVELWNSVSPAPPLDPAAGRVLTNGDFSHAPEGHGFDWRLPSPDGKRANGLAAQWEPFRMLLSLSGSQPEVAMLLEQTLPLAGIGGLRVIFEYSTAGLADPTGLRWNLDGEDSPLLEPAPRERSTSVVFRTAPSGLRRLKLVYRREPGSVRAAGSIEIRNVRAESLPRVGKSQEVK